MDNLGDDRYYPNFGRNDLQCPDFAERTARPPAMIHIVDEINGRGANLTNVLFGFGERCRNEHGEYEVLGIVGDQMLVRYDNGKQLLLNVAIQTHIR